MTGADIVVLLLLGLIPAVVWVYKRKKRRGCCGDCGGCSGGNKCCSCNKNK